MIRRCCAALSQLSVMTKDLAVAGLNPHSGEHGLFGDEEQTAITPAVSECRAEGLPVTGPVSADSVFHLAHIGRFSGVLSLYHDQGHIATKTLDFERTISLTLGLPFLRTIRRPRNGARHRRPGHRQRGQHDRGHSTGRQVCTVVPSCLT